MALHLYKLSLKHNYKKLEKIKKVKKYILLHSEKNL